MKCILFKHQHCSVRVTQPVGISQQSRSLSHELPEEGPLCEAAVHDPFLVLIGTFLSINCTKIPTVFIAAGYHVLADLAHPAEAVAAAAMPGVGFWVSSVMPRPVPVPGTPAQSPRAAPAGSALSSES